MLCKPVLIYHRKVVRGYKLVMWTEEDGLRRVKWVNLFFVLGTHGVGDSVHAGVRN